MTRRSLVSACAFAMSGFFSNGHASPLVDLTTVPFVSYGDGQLYSLPIAQLICENTFGSADCTTYSVKSTPGALQNLVVIATGNEAAVVTTNFPGMDNAYRTPDSVSGSIYFAPSIALTRGTEGAVQNNNPTTWDSSLFALKTFLQGGYPVFYFNNYQDSASPAQQLGFWARLWITDAAGGIVPFFSGSFSLLSANRTPITSGGVACEGLGGSPSAYQTFPGGGGCTSAVDAFNVLDFADSGLPGDVPFSGTNAAPLGTDYIALGGNVCLNQSFVPVVCGGPATYENINHNLGSDTAAYAIIYPELNNLLAFLFQNAPDDLLEQYTFHMDVRLGCDKTTTDHGITVPDTGNADCVGRSLNAGPEQLFMASSAADAVSVTEPSTLALLAAVLGFSGIARKAYLQPLRSH